MRECPRLYGGKGRYSSLHPQTVLDVLPSREPLEAEKVATRADEGAEEAS